MSQQIEQVQKCIFLDRDGVLNVERGTYTYLIEDFELEYKVPQALKKLKELGYLLIVITNQAGIAKGLYSKNEVMVCHKKLQQSCNNIIDALYYSPYHPNYTASLSRKPDSLMFERAISKFNIDPKKSYMIGDKERDLIPAKKLGIETVIVNNLESDLADISCKNLFDFSEHLAKITQ